MITTFIVGLLAGKTLANQDSKSVCDILLKNSDRATDKRDVLTYSGPNATVEQIRRHACLLMTLAEPGGTIEIAPGCKVSPEVLQVKLNSTFIVRNRDTEEHLLRTGETEMRIPREGSKEYSADFGKGNGNFAYSCDNSVKPVGIIRIVLPN